MLSLRQESSSGEGRAGVEGNTFYGCRRRRISLHGVVRDMNFKCFLHHARANVWMCRARYACIIRSHMFSILGSSGQHNFRNSGCETLVSMNRTCPRHRLLPGRIYVLPPGLYLLQWAASGISQVDLPARLVSTRRPCGIALRRRRHSLCVVIRCGLFLLHLFNISVLGAVCLAIV